MVLVGYDFQDYFSFLKKIEGLIFGIFISR